MLRSARNDGFVSIITSPAKGSLRGRKKRPAALRLAIAEKADSGETGQQHGPHRRFGNGDQAAEQAVPLVHEAGGEIERARTPAAAAIADRETPEIGDGKRIAV